MQFVATPILVGLPPLLKDSIDGNIGFLGMERVVTGKHPHSTLNLNPASFSLEIKPEYC